MSTKTKTTGIPDDLLAELQETADRAALGVRDPALMAKASTSMDRLREEISRKHGLLDIGIPDIRELRDAEGSTCSMPPSG
jgi:hypothetical protein